MQKHQLQQHIQYNANIAKAVFKQESVHWQLTDQNGKDVEDKMVISATWPLNRPNISPIKDQRPTVNFRKATQHINTADYNVI